MTENRRGGQMGHGDLFLQIFNDGFGARVDVEFLVNAGDVRAQGAGAHLQVVLDFLVTEPLGQLLQHLSFTRAQPLQLRSGPRGARTTRDPTLVPGVSIAIESSDDARTEPGSRSVCAASSGTSRGCSDLEAPPAYGSAAINWRPRRRGPRSCADTRRPSSMRTV